MKYLERYIDQHCLRTLQFHSRAQADIIVVIPAYKESFEELNDTLLSLEWAVKKYSGKVLVLLLVNYRAGDAQWIKEAASALFERLSTTDYTFDCNIFIHEMKGKHAGVGLARKALMDAALLYYYSQHRDGLIVNLDADTQVASNYLERIQFAFRNHPEWEAASIAFSHRLDDDSMQTHSAIISYESHLRYFVNMQRLIGLPFAFQTVGSAMVVRAFAYAKMGGMPRKQAGEDFYFLHKYSKTGKLGTINDTLVYPSARKSDRVPFGTGKAVSKSVDENFVIKTYNPDSFLVLEKWLLSLFSNDKSGAKTDVIHPVLELYLKEIEFEKNWWAIQKHTASAKTRMSRFFAWFDAFALMKYLHFMRDNGFDDIPTDEAMRYLFNRLGLAYNANALVNLERLRQFDCGQS